MLRILPLTAFALVSATATALAHPGHVTSSGGHDHLVVVGAAIAAIVIAAVVVVARKVLKAD